MEQSQLGLIFFVSISILLFRTDRQNCSDYGAKDLKDLEQWRAKPNDRKPREAANSSVAIAILIEDSPKDNNAPDDRIRAINSINSIIVQDLAVPLLSSNLQTRLITIDACRYTGNQYGIRDNWRLITELRMIKLRRGSDVGRASLLTFVHRVGQIDRHAGRHNVRYFYDGKLWRASARSLSRVASIAAIICDDEGPIRP